MNNWPNQNYTAMVEYYGSVGENQTLLILPYTLKLAWEPTSVVKKLTCNVLVAESLHSIFEQTLKVYGEKDLRKLRLDVFGGCLNVRKMRGSTTSWSIHSWGAAIDLDPDLISLNGIKQKQRSPKKNMNRFGKL